MIFETFVCLDEASGQSPGLGVALARDIAQRHGGNLQLPSQWVQGASCVLFLPAASSRRAP